MKAISVFILCLMLSWHLSAGVSAFAVNRDVKQSAEYLLDRSDKENEDLAIQSVYEALTLFESIKNQ
jgi:hypothetical protein